MKREIEFKLYLITDRKQIPAGKIEDAVEEALKGGVSAVQLREKDLSIRELLNLAYRMRDLTLKHDAQLFINDRIDIAIAVGADGVHLGGTSMPAYAARKAGGSKLLIGVSTHSMKEAESAEQDGADFITLGPVFETHSKMQYGSPIGTELLQTVSKTAKIPVYALGGITLSRVSEVIQSGAHGIALISAILATDKIRRNTEEFMRLLK